MRLGTFQPSPGNGRHVDVILASYVVHRRVCIRGGRAPSLLVPAFFVLLRKWGYAGN